MFKVLCIADIKIHFSFPTGQFSFEGYHSPYWLDVIELWSSKLQTEGHSNNSFWDYKYKGIQIIPFEIINIRAFK